MRRQVFKGALFLFVPSSDRICFNVRSAVGMFFFVYGSGTSVSPNQAPCRDNPKGVRRG